MTELSLMEGFSVPERAQWLALVEKALKGADFERRLVARTADGLRIAPVYGRADAPQGLSGQQPGAAPYLRGASAATITPPCPASTTCPCPPTPPSSNATRRRSRPPA